jgi:hypothetical protein
MALTPRQFGQLSNRHRQDREHSEFMQAQIVSWIASTGFKSPKDPVTPRDFMPSLFGKQDKAATAKTVKVRGRRRKTIAIEARATMAHFMRGQ